MQLFIIRTITALRFFWDFLAYIKREMRFGAGQPFLAGQGGLFTTAAIARDNNRKLPSVDLIYWYGAGCFKYDRAK